MINAHLTVTSVSIGQVFAGTAIVTWSVLTVIRVVLTSETTTFVYVIGRRYVHGTLSIYHNNFYSNESIQNCYRKAAQLHVERGSSKVECRTRNRESPGSNPPFATVSKFGHFRSHHDAPGHSAV